MDYITADEAAKRWGITGRAVKYHLSAGRISGALKKGKLWLIPANAEHPADKRRLNKALEKSTFDLLTDLSYISASSTIPMPIHNPDAIMDIVEEDRVRLIYEAELSYLRGDFERIMTCFHKTEGDDATRLRICPITIVASISMGDYQAYTKIEEYLKQFKKTNMNSAIKATAEYSLATTAVSVLAPNMVPDWIKTGNFNLLLHETKPNAHYLRAKYFYCIGKFDIALAVAQTALTLITSDKGITNTDIYLYLTCAISCYALEQKEDAKHWLLSSMHLALPHGFITPFAELVTSLGGLIEQCLLEEFPSFYKSVMEQWERTWKNWIVFHNQFAKDNITLILSLREYHIAMLAARHVPYSKIAKQYDISIGRLKNIMLEIREKLFISNRDELEKFIL